MNAHTVKVKILQGFRDKKLSLLKNFTRHQWKNDINEPFYNKIPLLHFAIRSHFLPFVRFLHENYTLDFTKKDGYKRIAFDYLSGDLSAYAKIFKEDLIADVVIRSCFSQLLNKQYSALISLLENLKKIKADKSLNMPFDINNYQGIHCCPLLHMVIKLEGALEYQKKLATLLIKDLGYKVDGQGCGGNTLLHLIDSTKLLGHMRTLIPLSAFKKMAKVRNKKGDSVLHTAAACLSLTTDFLVYKCGMKATLVNNANETVLHMLCKSNGSKKNNLLWIFLLKYLIYYGDGALCLDEVDNNGKSISQHIQSLSFSANIVDSDDRRKRKAIAFLRSYEPYGVYGRIDFGIYVCIGSYLCGRFIGSRPISSRSQAVFSTRREVALEDRPFFLRLGNLDIYEKIEISITVGLEAIIYAYCSYSTFLVANFCGSCLVVFGIFFNSIFET